MKKLILCRVICVFNFFAAVIVRGEIHQRPLNEATSVGGQTVFNCSSNTTASITWLYTTDCSNPYTPLTDSICNIFSTYASNFRTEKPDSIGSITVNATELVSGEDAMITSNVSYRGPSIPSQPSPPLPPSFYWTLLSDTSHNVTSYEGSTTNTTASSYIVVTVQTPNVPRYESNLFFNLPVNIPPSTATNAPTYVKNWVTPPYPVSYAPQNITISGTPNPCLHQPVVLICSASGYPAPTYQWFDLSSNAVLSERSTVTIQRGGSYQCIASNTIRNVPYSASTTVNVSDCDCQSNCSNTVIVLSVFLAIAILVIIGLFIWIVFGFMPKIRSLQGSTSSREENNSRPAAVDESVMKPTTEPSSYESLEPTASPVYLELVHSNI